MPVSRTPKSEIASELIRLLSLYEGEDLLSVARSARLHFTSDRVFISFSRKNTNKYNIANLTDRRVLVATTGAQQCPKLTALVVELINTALLNKTGFDFLGLEHTIDENEINNIFLSALLSTLSFR